MNGSVTYEGSTLLSGAINVNAGGNIEALNVQVTENGTRTIEASSGVDGYSPITIETNVPIPEPELDSITITENGTYTPPSGVDGFNEVNVDVITPPPVVETLNVTQNGTYTPPTGVDGFNEILVNVPSFPYYDFHEAEDGKIVVRRKFYIENNEVKIETLWFFNGYYFNSNIVNIPSDLVQFTKTNTDISGKTYTDNTSSTQNGWVAVSTAYYQNKLVCYSTSWGSDSNKTVWAVINNDGGTNQTLEWFDPYDV